MTAQPEEEFASLQTGVELCYQTFGERSAEPLVLVMGLGGPMTWWDPHLIEMLVEKGFYVIRFDNRDSGRSSGVGAPEPTRLDLARAMAGLPVPIAYTLYDMAGDIVALLDHLGVGKAHVAGVSMGGMIAQSMALAAPERMLSLTSISSAPRRLYIGWDLRLLPDLVRRSARTEDEYVESSLDFWRKVASPGYPYDWVEATDRARATWMRGVNEAGVMHQSIAIARQDNRTEKLAGLAMPTLVIHGLDDRLIHASGGRETARAIPRAEMILIPGMGHDLPPALFPLYARALARVASRSASQERHQ
jgi:pimeloyl-ACP methyl ester carboxylesterase